jgi:hypothetical protein
VSWTVSKFTENVILNRIMLIIKQEPIEGRKEGKLEKKKGSTKRENTGKKTRGRKENQGGEGGSVSR